jgi:hypothetical protein
MVLEAGFLSAPADLVSCTATVVWDGAGFFASATGFDASFTGTLTATAAFGVSFTGALTAAAAFGISFTGTFASAALLTGAAFTDAAALAGTGAGFTATTGGLAFTVAGFADEPATTPPLAGAATAGFAGAG